MVQKKVTDKPPRQYKLSAKQAVKAKEVYKEGISLSKLRKLVGASKQSVSLWMREQKVAKPQIGGLAQFRQDVKSRQRTDKLPYREAVRRVRGSSYWFEKRLAKFVKSFEPLEKKFQAAPGQETGLTKKQNERRRWLKGKIQSEKMKNWYMQKVQDPQLDREDTEDLFGEDALGEYESWGE